MENAETNEKSLDTLKRLVSAAYSNLERISHIIEKIEQEQRRELYKNIPGVEGVYDGQYLLGEDGKKYEVPANYAAKSRLVYGDKLKMIEEVGKTLFKQLEKVERKKLEGVLSKKEGKWYVLTNEGTFKISDVAAEFNNAALNEKAVVIVPAGNVTAEFAALDRIVRSEKESSWKEKEKVSPSVATSADLAKKPTTHMASVTRSSVAPAKRQAAPSRSRSSRPSTTPAVKAKQEDTQKEFVADISGGSANHAAVPQAAPPQTAQTTQTLLDDDDLV